MNRIKPLLMAIVNMTPDSYVAASRCYNLDEALIRIDQVIAQGADVIDIGAESTRPGAAFISEEEELRRLQPLFKELERCPIPVPWSIDTRRHRIAHKALEAGAGWINDVSGFIDPAMQSLAAQSSARLCVMHMQGDPSTMQQRPHYTNGAVREISQWLGCQTSALISLGVDPSRLVVDPGFGFGKTIADNLEILHNLHEFNQLGFPVLVGLSRKKFIRYLLSQEVEGVLPATLAVNSLAVFLGAGILRVHDIAEHRQLIDILGEVMLFGYRQPPSNDYGTKGASSPTTV